MKFLKGLGLGILWGFLFPFLAIGVALVGVFGVGNFIVQFVIMMINFFSGKKLFPPLKENEEALAIMEAEFKKQSTQAAPAPQPASNVYVQQNYYSHPAQAQWGPNPYGQPGIPQQPPYGQGAPLPSPQQGAPAYPQIPGQSPAQIQQSPYHPAMPELAKFPAAKPEGKDE